MQHVISSTANGTTSNNPTIVWAEEGISTGAYTGGSSDDRGGPKMTIRCVRNLGDVGLSAVQVCEKIKISHITLCRFFFFLMIFFLNF